MKRSQPQRETTPGLQTVPGSPTDLYTKDIWVHQIIASNKSAGTVTFTVTDRQDSAKTLVPTVSITANGQYAFYSEEGVCCLGGLNWASDTAGAIDAEVFGYVAG